MHTLCSTRLAERGDAIAAFTENYTKLREIYGTGLFKLLVTHSQKPGYRVLRLSCGLFNFCSVVHSVK